MIISIATLDLNTVETYKETEGTKMMLGCDLTKSNNFLTKNEVILGQLSISDFLV